MLKAAFLIIISLFLAGCTAQANNNYYVDDGLPLYNEIYGSNEYIQFETDGTSPFHRIKFNKTDGAGGFLVYNDDPNSFILMTMAGTDRGTQTSFGLNKSDTGRFYTVNGHMAIGTFTYHDLIIGSNDSKVINVSRGGNVTIDYLAGVGSAYVCVDSDGMLYRADSCT